MLMSSIRLRAMVVLAVYSVSMPFIAASHPLEEAYSGFWNSNTNGNRFTEICPRNWEPGKYDPCGSYVAGVIDGLVLGRITCPPDGVTMRQLATISHQAIWNDPTRWNVPAAVVIGERLEQLYPCALKVGN